MLDTDSTATVDDLEHDLADLDEVELPLEQHPNGGSATTADDEAATATSVALAPPVEEPTEVGDLGSMRVDASAVAIPASHGPAQSDPALEGYIVARRREIAAEVATALE